MNKSYSVVKSDKKLKIVEIEAKISKDEITCNGIPLEAEAETEYEYDYYLAHGSSEEEEIDFTFAEITETTEFLHDYRDSDSDKDDLSSDDSNAEDNWRNDYPDEEEYNYYDEADSDLEERVNGLGLDDEDGESDGGDYKSYEHYKKRMMKELFGRQSSESDEDQDQE